MNYNNPRFDDPRRSDFETNSEDFMQKRVNHLRSYATAFHHFRRPDAKIELGPDENPQSVELQMQELRKNRSLRDEVGEQMMIDADHNWARGQSDPGQDRAVARWQQKQEQERATRYWEQHAAQTNSTLKKLFETANAEQRRALQDMLAAHWHAAEAANKRQ